MRKKNISHPRLYQSISRVSRDTYKVQYYSNIFDKKGKRQLISSKQDIVDPDNSIYKLNSTEFNNLNVVIKRQEKVLNLYKKRNESEKFKVVNESLNTFMELKILFEEWFRMNRGI